MFTLSPELKAKGEKAEADFRAWLNRSGVAYMYVEQSPLTVPEALRGRIKRPDYLVGIPHAGTLAFDVKAKYVYDDHFIFDEDEVQKLSRFARLFNLTVYFACVDDRDHTDRHWWVPLADLLQRPTERRGKRAVVTYPVAKAYEVDLQISFLGVMMQYSFHALEV